MSDLKPKAAALAFRDLLEEACKAVGGSWFNFRYLHGPGSDAETRYRERVYCYELYHQIRRLSERRGVDQAKTYLPYGEVAKHGLDTPSAGTTQSPDLVWHVPGTDQNATVVEVKSVAGIDDVKKDLQTLDHFLHAGYAEGILLVYGDCEPQKIIRTVSRAALQLPVREEPHGTRVEPFRVATSRITVLHHRAAGQRPDHLKTF